MISTRSTTSILAKEITFSYLSTGEEDTMRIVVFRVKSRGTFTPGIFISELQFPKEVDFTSPDFPDEFDGEQEPEVSWEANPFNALS